MRSDYRARITNSRVSTITAGRNKSRLSYMTT